MGKTVTKCLGNSYSHTPPDPHPFLLNTLSAGWRSAPVTNKLPGCGGKKQKNEEKTRKIKERKVSPDWLWCTASGLDRSSRHIDEEQLF